MSNKIGCMLCRLAKAWQPAQKQLFRVTSLFLCVILVFTFVPFEVFASGSDVTLYDYNGLLAEVLPDRGSSYPYQLIYKRTTGDYQLIISKTPVGINSSDTFNFYTESSNSYRTAYYKYNLNGTSWVYDSFKSDNPFPSFQYSNYYTWSNHNIVMDSDPSVIVYNGSSPVLIKPDPELSITASTGSNTITAGQQILFSIVAPDDFEVTSINWSILGDNDYTIINGSTGLAYIGSNHAGGTIIVRAFVNDEYEVEQEFVIVPLATESSTYKITCDSTDFYNGNSYQFYCVDNIDNSPADSVVWSIDSSSSYLEEGTFISSSGLLTIAPNQYSIPLTIKASNIDGTYFYSIYQLYIFSDYTSGGGGEGGDTPTPSPTPTPDTSDVIDSVDKGFTDLGDKVDKLGVSIVAGLLDGLLRLFIPTAEDLSAQMDEFKSWIDERIPILAVPVQLVQFTYDLFFGVTPELGSLTFPEIKWMDNVLIQSTNLNLEQYTWLNDLLPIIRTTLTAACCLAFVNWLIRKVKEISNI